jgi:hypothetical protein
MRCRSCWHLALLLPLAVGGCLGSPRVSLSPEAAVSACEGSTALALRARYPSFESVVLEPAATSRVERRDTAVGRQAVDLVVAGGGVARTGADLRPLRYVCLVAPDGEAVFVDVETVGGAEVLAECGATADPADRRACLVRLLREAERGLAEAEARAVRRARALRPKEARAEVDEPTATSIGAWRVYRDAECARRGEVLTTPSRELVDACRVELTRARARELSG